MVHPWVLHNDELRRADEPVFAAGQIGVLSGWGVFSTIRVARGVLFEFPRHYARMQRDAALMHVPFPDNAEALERSLLRLAQANGRLDCTLRVAVIRNKGGLWQASSLDRDYDVIALTADLHNWGRSVRLAIAPHGRYAQSKFAAAKILSWAWNLTLYEEAHQRGFDEVILLNERGEVSECTSANVFLVCGNTVYTPALRSGCLPGVTREVILQCIEAPGITIEEKDILPAELETADEVFITSTTRDLLPVVEIEGMRIQHRSNVRQVLEDAFGRYIDDYIGARADGLRPVAG
jgi:branched-chain amino acid aminotransferase